MATLVCFHIYLETLVVGLKLNFNRLFLLQTVNGRIPAAYFPDITKCTTAHVYKEMSQ